MIYHVTRHPALSRWLSSSDIINSLQHLTAAEWADLDPTFHPKIDEDFDMKDSGITRQSFCNVYHSWIRHCIMRREQSEEREREANSKRKEETKKGTSGYSRGGKYRSTVIEMEGTAYAKKNLETGGSKESDFPNADIQCNRTEDTLPSDSGAEGDQELCYVDTSFNSTLVSLCLALSLLGRRALGPASHNENVEFFLHGLHALFKGDFRITCERDEWVFCDMELLHRVVAPAVRMSLKLHLDHFLVPDEYDVLDSLYEAMMEQQDQGLVIAHEADPCWRSAVLASKPQLLALRHVLDDGDIKYKIIMLNKRQLLFRVIKVNR